MGFIVIIGIIIIVGYYLSLRTHPFTKCKVCNGRGRHFSTFYTSAYRRCRKCGGTGRKNRFGAGYVNRNQKKPTQSGRE